MSKSQRSRRHFTTEQKVAILKKHMADKVPVSELCNQANLKPTVFYQWQRQALENLAGAITPASNNAANKCEKQLMAEVERLKARLAKKDSVIAEISAEYVQLKKELGEP
jgi:transposase